MIIYKLDIIMRRWVIEGTHRGWAQTNSYINDTWLRIIYHWDHGCPKKMVRSGEGQLINGHYLALVWKQKDLENCSNHNLHSISPTLA